MLANQVQISYNKSMEQILFQIILFLGFIVGVFQGIHKMKTSTINYSKTNNPFIYLLGLDR
jgi:hypothetical protein